MNKDLEETLDELGPAYRALAERVCAAYAPAPRAPRRFAFRRSLAAGFLVAAGLLVLLGAFLPSLRPRGAAAPPSDYTLAYAADARALDELVRTQRADGSWENDCLTRQNAAALRRSDDDAGRIAFRKAVRYLRSRGLAPLTEEEWLVRSRLVARLRAV